MNPLQDTEFQAQVRVSMNAILMNLETCLLKRQRNDLVLVGMYAVANSLIIHMVSIFYYIEWVTRKISE